MKTRDLAIILRRIPELPNEAIIPDPVAALILNISLKTLKRTNPIPRIQISPRVSGRQLGAIRQLGRGYL
jgi:hypothetical protein